MISRSFHMAINPNRPIMPEQGGLDNSSMSKINKVTKTALEAVADKIYDADGDKTSFKDVSKAYNTLNPAEKLTLKVGAAGAGVLPALSLVAEEAVSVGDHVIKGANKLAKEGSKVLTEKYKHPPEEKLIKDTKNFLEKMGDGLEEFADDVIDGRVLRDVNKATSRFVRDNFTDRNVLEKAADAVKDVAEDAAHAAADMADDIADGRVARQIKHKLND